MLGAGCDEFGHPVNDGESLRRDNEGAEIPFGASIGWSDYNLHLSPIMQQIPMTRLGERVVLRAIKSSIYWSYECVGCCFYRCSFWVS